MARNLLCSFVLGSVLIPRLIHSAASPHVNESDLQCIASLQGRDWGSMRIGVHYGRGRASSALMSLVKQSVIPKLTEFWSHAIEVRRIEGLLLIQRECVRINGRCVREVPIQCESRNARSAAIPEHLLAGVTVYDTTVGLIEQYRIPSGSGEDVDFVLLVSFDDAPNCGSLDGGTIATAFSCRFDSCGRPLVGSVNICPRAIDPSSRSSVESLYSTLAHEMTHSFGFNSDFFASMRFPDGRSRIDPSTARVVHYACDVRGGKPVVNWDISPEDARKNFPNSQIVKYTFPSGLVAPVHARGISNKCRCPVDASKTYSSADIEYCLTHKHECAFAITSPRVAAVTRAFFDCPSVTGAELENQTGSVSCSIFDSHWKEHLFGEEYMTSTAGSGFPFVSPITFALLEDLGWYRANYDYTSVMIPGSTRGYKAGCGLVEEKCVGPKGAVVALENTDKHFCASRTNFAVCSANAMTRAVCDHNLERNGPLPPPAYQYAKNGNSRLHDFCPVLLSLDSQDCVQTNHKEKGKNALSQLPFETYGKSSRCLDTRIPNNKGSAGLCFSVACKNQGTEYIVSVKDKSGKQVSLAERCKKRGQRLMYGDIEITCADPRTVCSLPEYPHVPHGWMTGVVGAVKSDFSRNEAKDAVAGVHESSVVPVVDAALAKSGAVKAYVAVMSIVAVVVGCIY